MRFALVVGGDGTKALTLQTKAKAEAFSALNTE